MKADLAIYTYVLAVPGQYESVALMLSYKMDFNCCANRDGFCKSSHIYTFISFNPCVYLDRSVYMGLAFICINTHGSYNDMEILLPT